MTAEAARLIEPLRGRKRTHRCGDLRPEHAGMKARLSGKTSGTLTFP